ncbi:MAG TPA: glycosyltransferase [Planctomycetota bacterium]|nr:glycosyltransferase [Planctomycetota bacterium]
MVQISVIIPTYNSGDYLEATLQSVLEQTVRPAEIIVVDDASTDDTLERLKKFAPYVKVINTGVNTGSASAPRNLGIEVSRCPYFAPFDSDDLMLPEKLQHSIALLRMRPDLPVLFTDFSFFGDVSRRIPQQSHCTLRSRFRRYLQPVAHSYYALQPSDALNSLFHENFVGASSIMCSKAAWRAVGGYNEKLKSAEDLDFSFRLAERFPFGYVDKVLHRYRLRGDSKSSNKLRNYSCALSVLRRYVNYPASGEAHRGLREQILDFETDLACLCSENGRIPEALQHFWQALRLGGLRRRLLRPSRKLLYGSAAVIGGKLPARKAA